MVLSKTQNRSPLVLGATAASGELALFYHGVEVNTVSKPYRVPGASRKLVFPLLFCLELFVISRLWRRPSDRSLWPILPPNHLYRWHGTPSEWVGELLLLFLLLLISWGFYQWLSSEADPSG